jgi:hypothetical protein
VQKSFRDGNAMSEAERYTLVVRARSGRRRRPHFGGAFRLTSKFGSTAALKFDFRARQRVLHRQPDAVPHGRRPCARRLAPSGHGATLWVTVRRVESHDEDCHGGGSHFVRRDPATITDQAVAILAPVIAELLASGVTSLRSIAAALNERGIPTVAGAGCWRHVQNVKNRFAASSSQRLGFTATYKALLAEV